MPHLPWYCLKKTIVDFTSNSWYGSRAGTASIFFRDYLCPGSPGQNENPWFALKKYPEKCTGISWGLFRHTVNQLE